MESVYREVCGSDTFSPLLDHNSINGAAASSCVLQCDFRFDLFLALVSC